MKTKVEKIQEYGEKKKTGKILKYLENEDKAIREAAFEALSHCDEDDDAAISALQKGIRDGDEAVRKITAKAFQRMGNNRVSETLHHQMLQEKNPQIKLELEKAMDFTRDRKPE